MKLIDCRGYIRGSRKRRRGRRVWNGLGRGFRLSWVLCKIIVYFILLRYGGNSHSW